MNIQELMDEALQTAKEHGFREEPGKPFAVDIALIHSELSEALDEYRDDKLHMYLGEKTLRPDAQEDSMGNWPAHAFIRKPEGAVVEFADAIIRIAETCKFYGLDLEDALIKKMEYNKSRPYKHGRVNL